MATGLALVFVNGHHILLDLFENNNSFFDR